MVHAEHVSQLGSQDLCLLNSREIHSVKMDTLNYEKNIALLELIYWLELLRNWDIFITKKIMNYRDHVLFVFKMVMVRDEVIDHLKTTTNEQVDDTGKG